MLRILVITCLLFPLCLASQHTWLFSTEAGLGTTIPFETRFQIEDDHTSTSSYTWEGKLTNHGSSYGKAGLERPLNLSKKFQLSFPLRLSYLNSINKLEMKGGEWGCMGGFGGTRTIEQNNFNGILSLGPKIIYRVSGKVSLHTGINFSGNILIYSANNVNDKSDYLVGEAIYNYNYSYVEALSNLSFQTSAYESILFKLSERVDLGITSECIFKTNYISKKYFWSDDFYLGFKKPPVYLNTGVRLQYSF